MNTMIQFNGQVTADNARWKTDHLVSAVHKLTP